MDEPCPGRSAEQCHNRNAEPAFYHGKAEHCPFCGRWTDAAARLDDPLRHADSPAMRSAGDPRDRRLWLGCADGGTGPHQLDYCAVLQLCDLGVVRVGWCGRRQNSCGCAAVRCLQVDRPPQACAVAYLTERRYRKPPIWAKPPRKPSMDRWSN